MSTHNICFHGEIKKYQYLLVEKKHLIKGYGTHKILFCVDIRIRTICKMFN